MKRRSFLASIPLAAAGAALSQSGDAAAFASGNNEEAGQDMSQDSSDSKTFRFHDDGAFKILSVSDFHYIPRPDPYGIALTEYLISTENPDLVIVNGDTITGYGCKTAQDMWTAADNVAAAMEKMKVRWAVTLGNHDLENEAGNHVTRRQLISHYEKYPYNVNGGWNRDIHGAGNKHMLVWSADGSNPLFSVWILDSGGGNPTYRYDWIHADQVSWYHQTSLDLESRYGGKVPGLMFFHIPLQEFREMLVGSKTIGERHEPECPSDINGGMFGALVDRGDVRGVFCGHDHVNNYLGRHRGIVLGYDGVAGFFTYPHIAPDDVASGRARGGRVFLISASDPGNFKTWMRFRDGSTNWESSSYAYDLDDNASTNWGPLPDTYSPAEWHKWPAADVEAKQS